MTVDDWTREDYEALVEEQWPRIREQFNFPMVKRIRMTDEEDQLRYDTAAYSWDENEIIVSDTFLQEMHERIADTARSDPDQGLERFVGALEKHEVGHYTHFPRRLSDHIVYTKRAHDRFGDKLGPHIYGIYQDVVDEMHVLRSGIGGEDIQDLRHLVTDDPDTYDGDSGYVDVHRLMLGIYQESFPDLPEKVEPTEAEEDYLGELLRINYLDQERRHQERNLVMFGTILEDLLQSQQDNQPGGSGDAGDEGQTGDGYGGACPEDRGKADEEKPFGGPGLEGIPQEELDRALDEILQEDGRGKYEEIKEFLESVREEYTDRFDRGTGTDEDAQGIGLGRADLSLNEDDVPFYRRWASQFPVYIAERPVETDESQTYRSGRKGYELGDPINDINPFASRGAFGLPGVSQVDLEEAGTVPAEDKGIPDLLVGLDSSGSMPHPSTGRGAPDQSSYAVLAAFVLGTNYYDNGADVGGYNFSTDMAFKAPDRDLDTFEHLMAAYWGGGTFVNTAKLEEFVGTMDDFDDIVFSGDEDYEQALERIPEQQRDEVVGKDVDVSIDEVQGNYGRLDHVLITDGGLANKAETLQYINDIGEYTRNFVFLTGDRQYKEWKELEVENTFVYRATDEDDLMDLSLGVAKDMAGYDAGGGTDSV